jgi:hypothetical protein
VVADAVALVRCTDPYADPYAGAAGLDELRQRVEGYLDPAGSTALRELGEQAVLLDALFVRLSTEALASRKADHGHKLMRMALGAQQAYCRTVALAHGLALQAKGKARVIVDGEAYEQA